jgi:methyl-accepting chemotaxis protein
MKVSSKLYAGFGAIVLIAVIVQVVLVVNVVTVKRSLENFNTLESRLKSLADDMRFYDSVLTATVGAIMLEPSNQALRTRYDDTGAALDAVIQEASALAPDEEDRQLFSDLAAVNAQILDAEQRIIRNPGSEEALSLYSGQYTELERQYAQLIATFHERETIKFAEGQAAIQSNLTFIQGVSLSLAVGLAVLAVILAVFLSRNISVALAALMEATSAVSQGDLTKRVIVTNKDELGTLANIFNQMTENLERTMASQVAKDYIEGVISEYRQFVGKVADGDLTVSLALNGNRQNDDLYELGINLNNMVHNLGEMASQINETAQGVSAAAAEILASTTQQIASTTEQEAAVTQTMTTVEEVKTTVKQTAERAQSVAEVSRQSVQISVNGQNSVADSVNGMKLIRQKVESIAENILMLSERTQQIGEIIDTVNEIAAQSKLLALNASIEAARAGEDGKGFAVVVMEVRQLAEQSRDATARVRDILNQIQQATNTAVMVTEEGSKGAETGMTLVEKAGVSIEALSQTIEEASQAAIQIAASTNQQNNGMEQLAQAMSSIKQATTQAAASTRQAEQSAKDLNKMAQQMQDAVRRYQLR